MKILVVTSINSLRTAIGRALKAADPAIDLVEVQHLTDARRKLAQYGARVGAVVLDTSAPVDAALRFNSSTLTALSFLRDMRLTSHIIVTVSTMGHHRTHVRRTFGYPTYPVAVEMSAVARRTLSLTTAAANAQ